jgi:hypothetical protein
MDKLICFCGERINEVLYFIIIKIIDVTATKKIEQENKLLIEENNKTEISNLIQLKTCIAF